METKEFKEERMHDPVFAKLKLDAEPMQHSATLAERVSGRMSDTDSRKLEAMEERIRTARKYRLLAKRS